MNKRILIYLSLIVELLLILSCVFSLFKPLSKYEYKEGELLVSQGENVEHFIIETPRTDLKRGSYEVKINYGASSNANVYAASSESNYYQMKIGRQNISLNPERNECGFSIESNLDVDGYSVKIDSIGKDDIRVDKVSIVETASAKIKNLITVIFLIVVVNSGWIVYKKKPELFERKKLIVTLLLGICIFFASMPIWTPYLFYGHDLYFHLNRIEGIKNALLAGNIPARMHYSALEGAGYPTSIYYGDVFLYIPVILRLLGWSVQSAYQGYILSINILTCIITYKVFQRIFKNEWIAVLGSYMYMMAPYRLECIYLRAAVGEYTAACFYPLILYGLYCIYTKEKEKKNNGWIIFALGFSGLLLSHIISTFITFCIVLLFCILFIKKTLRKETFIELCKAVILTLGICAGFLVPFVDYMSAEVKVNTAVFYGDFEAWTVGVSQLLTIFPHGKGFTNTFYGELISENLEMTYAVGGALILAPLVYGIYYLCVEYQREQSEKLGKVALVLASLCLFMTTSYFPWNEIEELGEIVRYFMYSIQFPWRFLSVSTMLLVIVLTVAISGLKNHLDDAVYYNLVAALCVLAFVSSNYFMSDFMKNADKNYVVAEGDVDSSSIGNGEYLLVGATTKYEGILYEEERVIIADARRMKDIYLVECNNTSDEVQYVQVPIINYENYYATDVATGEGLKIETGEQGRIKVELPKNYSGEIMIEYKVPWYWHLSEVISLGTIMGVGIFVSQKRKE